MGLDDIVHIVEYKRSGRHMLRRIVSTMEIIQVSTTHKFNPPSIKKSYMLEDGNWYDESSIEHDIILSRDNKISKIV